MNLFISSSRWLLPPLAALVLFGLIELSLFLFLPKSLLDSPSRSPVLHMAYFKPIRSERYIMTAKLQAQGRQRGEIIQVGDSTGLLGVDPVTVMKYLPDGMRYINLSGHMPLEWQGFMSMAKENFRHNPDRKYLVVFSTMLGLARYKPMMGAEMEKYYLSPWAPLFRLPSLSVRPFMLNSLFYWTLDPSAIFIQRDTAKPVHGFLEELTKNLEKKSGWTPITHGKPVGKHGCNLPVNPDLIAERLDSLAAFAKENGVRLILAFAPTYCEAGNSLFRFVEDIEKFAHRHPEVIVARPIYRLYPAGYFSDAPHLSPDGAVKFSNDWGSELSEIIQNAD